MSKPTAANNRSTADRGAGRMVALRAGELPFRIALALMKWGSGHSRFGHQVCYTASFVKPGEDGLSEATRREFLDGQGFFEPFQGSLSPRDLARSDVLDLGCGHGGRTGYYAIHGEPRSIVGVEISFERVGVAGSAARKLLDDPRMMFAAGVAEALPFAESSFDTIISYDVFEHVQDLRAALAECHRVLRPGGRLYSVFPPYYGPRAHHLDFVTTLPFLHHLFQPGVLVRAANQVLSEHPGLRDEPLPSPSRSYLGREVLPRLNGTTERDFLALIEGTPFTVEDLTLLPFAWGPGGVGKRAVRGFCRVMLKIPWPFTRDVFIGTIRCVLRKC